MTYSDRNFEKYCIMGQELLVIELKQFHYIWLRLKYYFKYQYTALQKLKVTAHDPAYTRVNFRNPTAICSWGVSNYETPVQWSLVFTG